MRSEDDHVEFSVVLDGCKIVLARRQDGTPLSPVPSVLDGLVPMLPPDQMEIGYGEQGEEMGRVPGKTSRSDLTIAPKVFDDAKKGISKRARTRLLFRLNSRVHDGAFVHHHAPTRQVALGLLEQRPGQSMGFQKWRSLQIAVSADTPFISAPIKRRISSTS